ncbi:MAG: glycosyltransferase family 2 protein, partial [Acidobacteria bacterium]|nr:glycosyltransferase family 2 protein [Acidobacteriota bacterium]
MSSSETTSIMELLRPIPLDPLPPEPLVSILIANYNYARFVGQAIESVLGQLYHNFEVVICDDGSTDESWQVIESYTRRDPRVRAVRQANGGQGAALNAALSVSRGKIVCLLDSDDSCLPQRLQVVVEAFQHRAESGLLMHGLYLVDKGNRREGVVPLFRQLPSGWLGPHALRRGGDLTWMVTSSSAICLRREIAERAAARATEFRISADCGIFSLAILMTPMIGLSVPLGAMREHSANNLSTSFITQAWLDRHVKILEQAWNAQRSYLADLDPRLMNELSPLDTGLLVPMMRYIGASFRGEQRISSYRNFVDNKSFPGLPLITRSFWKASILVPRWLFARALWVLWGRNRLRRWASWIAMELRSRARILANSEPT